MIPAPWTMQQLDTLRAMWAEGATCSEIGTALNRSRSAIAGKVRRMDLPRRTQAHSAHKRWENTPRPPKPQKPFLFKQCKPHERKPPMFLRVVSVPDSKPVPLVERTGCCYPTTGQGPHLFCNEPVQSGDYCEFHRSVMYTPRRGAA